MFEVLLMSFESVGCSGGYVFFLWCVFGGSYRELCGKSLMV